MGKKLVYITGNESKLNNARNLLEPFNITVVQKICHIDEIQSEKSENITLDKAKKAFDIVKEPLFVNDASWIIPALNGFPGPYMKYVNTWFSPQDFLDLMSKHTNREVIFRETIVYIDKNTTKIFSDDHKGIMLTEVRGEVGAPSDKVISLSTDRLSLSEAREKKIHIDTDNKLWE